MGNEIQNAITSLNSTQ